MIADFIPFIAGIMALALGMIVLFNGAGKKNSKWPFVIFATSVGLWAIFINLFLVTDSLDAARIFVGIYYVAALFIAYGFLIFSLYYTMLRVSRWVVVAAFLPLIALSITIAAPGLFVEDVVISPFRSVSLVASTYLVYAATFIAYVAIALGQMLRRPRIGQAQAHRWVLAVSMVVSLSGGAYFNLLLPLLGNYQLIALGPMFVFVMVASVFYVIARQGLFDIRFAVVRTVTYVMSLATLASLYLLILFFVFDVLLGQTAAPNEALLNVILTLLLAFLFQPIKNFFDRVTNRLFYRYSYNVDDFYARLNRVLTSTTDLRELLERAAIEIGKTLKSEQTFFFIYTDNDHFVSGGTPHHKQLPRADALHINTVQEAYDGVIVASLLEVNDPIRRLMVSHKIELILHLVQTGGVVGYLCLGDHLTSGYTTRDMKVLRTSADELVIAIQNALSVQEVRALNATLQQRVNEATKELRASNAQLTRLDKSKDEFVSMASHQLRTPLTSVKGYLSMVLEGDAGKITSAQKHLLGEAFTSSERMVHLINDFLNVSRLQTGKFLIDKRPVSLAKVVEQELDSLVTTAASRNLSFSYKPPKDFPLLDLDEGKMQQVIMNFADNALYYSSPGTSIIVRLTSENNEAVFTVKDSGIGVPQAEQAQLFAKFYRASNARKQRPDGTGVGLFLAKKVIDAHGGTVIFESIEDQGSTFGFRLPIRKLASVNRADQLK